MNERQQYFYNFLKVTFQDNAAPESEVDAIYNNIFSKTGVTPEEAEAVKKRYFHNVGVQRPSAVSLVYKLDDDWFWKRQHDYDTKPESFLHFRNYLDYLSKFEDYSPQVTAQIKKNVENTLRFCANPKGSPTLKRGLVMGDVQSGKTSDYMGVINYAIDLGYKQIIVLAGMVEELRRQTQRRINKGVLGFTPGKKFVFSSETDGLSKFTGIGRCVEPNRNLGIAMTNDEADYGYAYSAAQNFIPSNTDLPLIYVVKKNAKILNVLLQRFKSLQKQGESEIGPVLIIDDECDNASVNTKTNAANDASTINLLIRQIVDACSICSYIGYTATPFATIFADSDDAGGQSPNLFPHDFVTLLRPSDEYEGPDTIFLGYDEEAESGFAGNDIDLLQADENGLLPAKHKKEDNFVLCNSLKDAICVFLLSNVVRTLRNDDGENRSMLVNISRFNGMQQRIAEQISDYVETLRNEIDFASNKTLEDFLHYPELKRIYDLWKGTDKNFKHCFSHIAKGNEKSPNQEFTFEQIKAGLAHEIHLFEVYVVNMQNHKKVIDYDNYKDIGARIIAVGGFTLSRGLTLKGLMTSYYNRHASAYDVLLQMGRWFGYHANYSDLINIFMTQENVDCFCVARDATEELKNAFIEMSAQGKTPSDFGLSVRESPDTLNTKNLLITAANKEKLTKIQVGKINLAARPVDTSKLFGDRNKNARNYQAVLKLIQDCFNNGGELVSSPTKKGIRYFTKVPASAIVELLESIVVPPQNIVFDQSALKDFIANNSGPEGTLSSWDVALGVLSDQTNGTHLYSFGPSLSQIPEFRCPVRSAFYDKSGDILRFSGNHNQITTPSFFNVNLLPDQIAEARKKAYDRAKQRAQDAGKQFSETGNYSPTAIDYLSVDGARPILMLIPMFIRTDGDPTQTNHDAIELAKLYRNEPIWGFALGFPGKKEQKMYAFYRLNKVAQEQSDDDDSDDDEGAY